MPASRISRAIRLRPNALALAALAALCLFRLKVGLLPTLGVTALVGLVAKLALG